MSARFKVEKLAVRLSQNTDAQRPPRQTAPPGKTTTRAGFPGLKTLTKGIQASGCLFAAAKQELPTRVPASANNLSSSDAPFVGSKGANQ